MGKGSSRVYVAGEFLWQSGEGCEWKSLHYIYLLADFQSHIYLALFGQKILYAIFFPFVWANIYL